MFKKIDNRIWVGIMLIVVGVVYLLDNLGVISIGNLVWGVLMVAAGIGFVAFFIVRKRHWWALIPGISLISVGALVILEYFLPSIAQMYGGTLVLGGIALSFFAVYLVNPSNWWAIIPGGVMLTLGGITLLDQLIPPGNDSRGIGGGFFLGLGLTFLLVYLLPSLGGRNTWAIFPSAALFLVGLLILASAENIINYIWPVVLIVLGAALIIRNLVWKT